MLYDYYLGGKDNFEPDRIAAEKVLALVPWLRRAAAIPKETELMAARRTGREPARRAITQPGAELIARAWCTGTNSATTVGVAAQAGLLRGPRRRRCPARASAAAPMTSARCG